MLGDVVGRFGMIGGEAMDGLNFIDYAANAYPDFQTTEQSKLRAFLIAYFLSLSRKKDSGEVCSCP